jgi:hypothetical protein
MLINLFSKTKYSDEYFQSSKNLASILLSSYCLYALVNNFDLDHLCKLILVHSLVDIFVAKPDIIFHHLCIVAILTFKYYHNVLPEHNNFTTKQLIATEISSIFYTSGFYLKDLRRFLMKYSSSFSLNKMIIQYIKINEAVNSIIFICLFCKLRIYDYFHNIILNPNIYEWHFYYAKYNVLANIHVYSGIYGLFALNLYWLLLIVNKIYKTFFEKYETYIWNEYLLKYTYFASFATAFLTYSFYNKSENHIVLLDLLGIGSLSVTSYYYHESNYESLIEEGDEFNTVDPKRIWYYIHDTNMISIRSFFTVVTNVLIKKNFQSGLPLLYFSGLIHSASMYHRSRYLLELQQNNIPFPYNNHNTNHGFIINLHTGIPIFLDTFFLMHQLEDIYLICCNILVLFLLCLVTHLRPFSKMNHFFIHLLLVFETYILCRINAKVGL